MKNKKIEDEKRAYVQGGGRSKAPTKKRH